MKAEMEACFDRIQQGLDQEKANLERIGTCLREMDRIVFNGEVEKEVCEGNVVPFRALKEYLEVYEKHGVGGCYSKHYLDVLGTWLNGLSEKQVRLEMAKLDQALLTMKANGQIPRWMGGQAHQQTKRRRAFQKQEKLPKAWLVHGASVYLAWPALVLGLIVGYLLGLLG